MIMNYQDKKGICTLSNSISDAINKKFILEIEYPPCRRIIEPHALGYGADGQILLRAFQISGVSASGEHVNWKLFRLDKLQDDTPTGGTFDAPRPGYKRNDSAMKNGIIAQL
jgi:hypothetical protein